MSLSLPSTKFDSEEDDGLLQASERFEKDASRFYPDRPCVTTVIDLAGKTIFITRYIRALNPPKEFLDGVPSNGQEVRLANFSGTFCSNLTFCRLLTQALVARYVSLIPSLPDRVLFSASCDLWSTCDVSNNATPAFNRPPGASTFRLLFRFCSNSSPSSLEMKKSTPYFCATTSCF